MKFYGDNITDFILKKFDGSVLIASDKKALDPNEPLSLGLLDDISDAPIMELEEALMENTNSPLKAFRIGKVSDSKNSTTSRKAVEFVFEDNDDSVKNLSNYLTKSQINLAFLNLSLIHI